MKVANKRGAGPSDEGTMAASVVAGVVGYALTRGLSMEGVNQATGLTLTDILDPDARLPDSHVPTLWRIIQAAHPGEAVTLGIAQAVPSSFFGPLVYGVRHSETLGEAMDVFIRYQKILSSGLRIEGIPRQGGVLFRFSHPTDRLDGGLGAEAGLVMGKRFMEEVFGDGEQLLGVEFMHQPFGPAQAYESFFQTKVDFGCAANGIVLSSAALGRRPREPDPRHFRHIQGHLDAVKERLEGGDQSKRAPLAPLRQAIAANGERGEYGAEAVARAAGMSLRSCQRLAKQEGTTLRALLDEAREANARQLLTDDSLTIDAISFLLGYSSEGAFRRAFHRWTGLSPTQVKREMRA